MKYTSEDLSKKVKAARLLRSRKKWSSGNLEVVVPSVVITINPTALVDFNRRAVSWPRILVVIDQ
jgi:hypothetical protein